MDHDLSPEMHRLIYGTHYEPPRFIPDHPHEPSVHSAQLVAGKDDSAAQPTREELRMLRAVIADSAWVAISKGQLSTQFRNWKIHVRVTGALGDRQAFLEIERDNVLWLNANWCLDNSNSTSAEHGDHPAAADPDDR